MAEQVNIVAPMSRQPAHARAARPHGNVCGMIGQRRLPAARRPGQPSPWSLTVPFHAAPGQLITIVVHTGGHVAAVERFAVTGVLVG